MVSTGFVDDATIFDNSLLWRRIHAEWVVADENTGIVRVSSAAFDNSRDGSPTSVLLADSVAGTGRTAQDVIMPFEGYSLAAIRAGDARNCRQGIARAPLPDEPAHAYIFGPKAKRQKQCLSRSAMWVIAPAGV